MPSGHATYCRTCYEQGIPRNDTGERVRRTEQHTGRGCAWDLCRHHCTCTHEAREAFRNVRESLQFRCELCNNISSHVCVQTVRYNHLEHGTLEVPSSHSHCALHCRNRECQDSLPCSSRERPYVTIDGEDVTHFQCWECGIRQPSERFSTFRYVGEDQRAVPVCVGCTYNACRCRIQWGRVPNIDDRYTCDDCGRCTIPETHRSDGQICLCRGCIPQRYGCCRCAAEREERARREREERLQRSRPRLHPARVIFSNTGGPVHERYNPLARAAGVEIEVAGFREPTREALEALYNTCVAWSAAIGTDATVRNGVEIRTSPASGFALVKQLRDILRAVNAANGIVDNTAGLHVHVDMRDTIELRAGSRYHANVLDRLTATWWEVENAFYAMVAPYRATEDHYCKRMREHHSERPQSRRYYNGISDRYYGLNLTALQKYHTVEFRLHHGCINRRQVTAWTLLCVAYVEKIITGYESVDAAINDISEAGGAVPWLQRLAPTEDAKRYITWRAERTAREREREAA